MCLFDLEMLHLHIYPNNCTHVKLYTHTQSTYSTFPTIVKTGINLSGVWLGKLWYSPYSGTLCHHK